MSDTGRPPRGAGPFLRRVEGHPSRDVGQEPDPRFTFANERTFLAWNRTALALIAGGVVVADLVKFDVRWLHLVAGIPLILFGGVLGAVSYRDWMLNERALRLDRPLPYPPGPRVLSAAIVVMSVALVIVVVLDAVLGG